MRSFLLALLIWPLLSVTGYSTDPQKVEKVDLESYFKQAEELRAHWYDNRMKEWDSLVRQAGQNKSGLVLQALILNDTQDSPSRLLVGVRNVGNAPVQIGEGASESPPFLLIRDDKGKSVSLTDQGKKYHDIWRLGVGSNRFGWLTPGEVRDSFSIPLQDNFNITPPGRYTAVALKSVMIFGEELIAKPVTFELAEATWPNRGGKRNASSPKKSPLSGDALNDWATLEKIAGLPQQDYLLEADISPVNPESMNLIVSLVHLDTYRSDDDTPFFASSPKSYKILVRDSDGKFISVNESARNAFIVEKKNEAHGCNVGLGQGNGAMIPLAKWFEMSTGEYTVLVSLSFPGKSNTVCVAKPFKTQVTRPRVISPARQQ